jgi:hypothetical protein
MSPVSQRHSTLDRSRRMFHFCSHGSGDIGRSSVLRVASPYAVRQRLPSGNAIHAPLRLPKAAGPRDTGRHRGPNFPLSRLESRLMCPACGNRRVTVVFEPPANSQVIGR